VNVKRIHIVASGRVQGVGYRYFCQSTAMQMGLTGWARNLPGRSVEVEVQGSVAELDRYREELAAGPALANVDNIEIYDLETASDETQFRIR
jgi:acylphosphatase